MNLTFGICWIEDQASYAEVEAVEEAVRNCGFEPELERVEKEDDIRRFARRQEQFQDYDLILLDLRLGAGLRGDDLAQDVRWHFRSTPILFYSAEDVHNLRRAMAERLVEGVYCAHRDGLSGRVGELVSDLSPALNRLSGMRGLAARVVAECDQEFRKVLHYWGRDPEHKVSIEESIKTRAREGNDRQLARTGQIHSLGDLLADPASSSSLLFSEVHARVGDMGVSDEVRTIRRELRRYQQKVLAVRNTLAHALEERTEDGWRISRRAPNPDLTVDDFAEYRSDFLTHLRHVRRLRELLVGQEPE